MTANKNWKVTYKEDGGENQSAIITKLSHLYIYHLDGMYTSVPSVLIIKKKVKK